MCHARDLELWESIERDGRFVWANYVADLNNRKKTKIIHQLKFSVFCFENLPIKAQNTFPRGISVIFSTLAYTSEIAP